MLNNKSIKKAPQRSLCSKKTSSMANLLLTPASLDIINKSVPYLNRQQTVIHCIFRQAVGIPLEKYNLFCYNYCNRCIYV